MSKFITFEGDVFRADAVMCIEVGKSEDIEGEPEEWFVRIYFGTHTITSFYDTEAVARKAQLRFVTEWKDAVIAY